MTVDHYRRREMYDSSRIPGMTEETELGEEPVTTTSTGCVTSTKAGAGVHGCAPRHAKF